MRLHKKDLFAVYAIICLSCVLHIMFFNMRSWELLLPLTFLIGVYGINQLLGGVQEVSDVYSSDLQFEILFPHNTLLNIVCDMECKYYPTGIIITAGSLNATFARSQNFDEEYIQYGVRSTSVGDIIIDLQNNKAYMILGMGFQELTNEEFSKLTDNKRVLSYGIE